MLRAFPHLPDSEQPAALASMEEIQAELERVRRQKTQLEEQERRLLMTLALATRSRTQEIVDAGGVAAPSFEGLLRSAVDSSRRTRGSSTTSKAEHALTTRKAPLRFRHPDDPGQVWSGRGKTPRWVIELQAQGRLELARIPSAEA